MSRIEVAAKEAGEGHEKLKEEIKGKMQASEAWVLAQIKSTRAVIEHLGSSTFIFPFDPSHIDLEPTNAATILQ